MSTSSETVQISLDWPADPSYQAVGRLVLGGIAARIDLPVDRIDELGLVLDTLARALVSDDVLQLHVDVSSERLLIAVGEFLADPLVDFAVRRVIAPLVDDTASIIAPGGHRVLLTVLTSGQSAE